jgi:heme-degrading monooxygenase HmoA
MHARLTRFDTRVDDIEKLNTYFNGTVIPTYSAMAGYKGALSFADRTKGQWSSITFWESEAAMIASEQAAKQLRENARQDFKTGEMTVEMYEVQTDRRQPGLEQPLASKQAAPETERRRH